MKLTIRTHSDDIVNYEFGDQAEEFGNCTKEFAVTLPNGTLLSIVADYNRGWEFSVDLPPGSLVEPRLNDEEEAGDDND